VGGLCQVFVLRQHQFAEIERVADENLRKKPKKKRRPSKNLTAGEWRLRFSGLQKLLVRPLNSTKYGRKR
jgi:hypothetical protein